MKDLRCKDCTYITVFLHPTTKKSQYSACDKGTPWVRSIDRRGKSCHYFKSE